MKKNDQCSVCKTKLKEEKIIYTQKLGKEVYVVSGVPAAVCPQCGEQYLSTDTVDRLQEVIEQGEKGKRKPIKQAPIFHYPLA